MKLKPGSKITFYICLVFISTLIVVLRYSHSSFDNEFLKDLFLQNERAKLKGIIISDPEYKKTYWRYEVLIKESSAHMAPNDTKILVKEKLRVPAKPSPEIKNNSQPTYGDYIKFSANISRPKVIESEDGRNFDYEYFLQKDNIFYLADISDVELISKNQAGKLTNVLFKIKKNFMQNVENLLPAPYAFLATGLVISGKGSLDKELQDQFQKVGLIHIVVLSGSNVSIVGEAISKFFSFLPKLWGGVFGSIGIICFGLMTGGGATVWRSVIMSIIGIWTKLSDRQNSGFIALMTAGTLMLFHNPKLLLHDPSFQLSFVATLGLIFLASPIEEILQSAKKTLEKSHKIFLMSLKYIPPSLISLIATSIATQIFTLPFIIRFSGVVSLVSLPVNTLVLPFIPFTMLFVFLTGVISFMSSAIAYLPAFVAYALLKYELLVVGYFSSLSFSSTKIQNISPATFALLYFVIVLLTILLNLGKTSSKNEQTEPHKEAVIEINTTPV
ncbi:MAG: ComEC/Rec2 family competence protein [Candidatus Pacebacteria bacterium]|nr:ComEC/Rec2 family competence protein [Candidatus Paceibacterota bacterium]MBP9818354.1 ComEC/Rec2 family competence protein [Candidatus Paceibacterota bacterium]